MNKSRRKIKFSRLITIVAVLLVFSFFVIRGFAALISNIISDSAKAGIDNSNKSKMYNVGASQEDIDAFQTVSDYTPISPRFSDKSIAAGGDIESDNAILICTDDSSVIASRNSKSRMYPASMTKVMSLIVAVEHIDDLDETYTMSYEVINPLVEQQATRTGLESGETVPLIDLLYGVILPSGADATISLAIHTAGSEENFVVWMNEKARELGLVGTHFTNTSGLHDSNHYTTAYDMAIILDCAMNNELCRRILSAERYTTTPTEQHPEGLVFSATMFERVSHDYIDGVEIVGGKTGYTAQSGHCLASYAVKDGKTYIAVTGGGANRYVPIYDIVDFYGSYI